MKMRMKYVRMKYVVTEVWEVVGVVNALGRFRYVVLVGVDNYYTPLYGSLGIGTAYSIDNASLFRSRGRAERTMKRMRRQAMKDAWVLAAEGRQVLESITPALEEARL